MAGKSSSRVTREAKVAQQIVQTYSKITAQKIVVTAAVVVFLTGCGGSKTTATTSKTETTQVSNSRQLEKPYFVLLADDICKGHDLAVKELKLDTTRSIEEVEDNHEKLVPVFKDTVESFDQVGYPSGDGVTIAFAYVDEWRRSYKAHMLALKAARNGDKAGLTKQEAALDKSLEKREELSSNYGFNECDSK